MMIPEENKKPLLRSQTELLLIKYTDYMQTLNLIAMELGISIKDLSSWKLTEDKTLFYKDEKTDSIGE